MFRKQIPRNHDVQVSRSILYFLKKQPVHRLPVRRVPLRSRPEQEKALEQRVLDVLGEAFRAKMKESARIHVQGRRYTSQTSVGSVCQTHQTCK